MPKSIMLSCDIKGTVEVEYPKLFEGENIHIKVIYPSGHESWTKYLDYTVGSDKENVIQPALTLDYVFKAGVGTIKLQPYMTSEDKIIKFDTVNVPINASIFKDEPQSTVVQPL